jgi:hypothetical protein
VGALSAGSLQQWEERPSDASAVRKNCMEPDLAESSVRMPAMPFWLEKSLT